VADAARVGGTTSVSRRFGHHPRRRGWVLRVPSGFCWREVIFVDANFEAKRGRASVAAAPPPLSTAVHLSRAFEDESKMKLSEGASIALRDREGRPENAC